MVSVLTSYQIFFHILFDFHFSFFELVLYIASLFNDKIYVKDYLKFYGNIFKFSVEERRVFIVI